MVTILKEDNNNNNKNNNNNNKSIISKGMWKNGIFMALPHVNQG